MVEPASAPGQLYIVSTPIGNLADITYRAVDVLRQVRRVLAEDTRHSRVLLERYAIQTRVESYHEHNEARMTPRVIGWLSAGEDVALISDAGTPLVSDPGSRLVQAAVGAGLRVVPVPGASALLSALVASGLPTDRFTFLGFLPRRGREREAALQSLSALDHTAVVYEAPARLADTLEELGTLDGGGSGRRVAVARELTKQFEEVRRGTAAELAAYYRGAPARGEIVIVIEGRGPEVVAEDELRARARALRDQGLSARQVAQALTQESGAPRNLAYRLAHET